MKKVIQKLKKIISNYQLAVQTRRAKKTAAKQLAEIETLLDIHTDKGGYMRFHIHAADNRIVATSNPYHDLALMKEDMDALLHGRTIIASS